MDNSIQPELARYMLESNWNNAIALLKREYEKDPDDLGTLLMLAEVSRMAGNPEDGIRFGELALSKSGGIVDVNENIVMVYNLIDLILTVATCYSMAHKPDTAVLYAEDAERRMGHPTDKTVNIVLNNKYLERGLIRLLTIDDDYLDKGIRNFPEAFFKLKVETARQYFVEIFKHCNQETMMLYITPETFPVLTDMIIKMHDCLNDVPDDYRDRQEFLDMVELWQLMYAQLKSYNG